MAKPPATTPSRGAWDGLLATKLYVPQQPAGFVPRPRLLKQLDEGLRRGLLLVCAPAGFGKTALLAHWASSGRWPVAWLSLDTGDNDPARFWRYVLAALETACPGLADEVTPLLDSPEPPSFEGFVTLLVNRLAAGPKQGEALLILDDYHLIEAQAVHTSLELLLERGPPGLHVVLASRADPPLPVARLRGRGQLAELRAGDLRFTAEEAAMLLREVGVEVPEEAMAALVARTEGWAAGLQLAGLSLAGQPDITAFIDAFSGSHRYVLDYLAEEVLDRQPEHLVRFLLDTSVLERLSGPLCDAVCGHSDSQHLLEQIERANLFLVPLDEVRGWWRYHQLFADLLRVRLQQQQPERVPELHRAAARWSEEQGLADDAVRHALAAGDDTWAAQLIERHADRLLVRGESATLAQWLAALPAELIDTQPRLLLAQALLALRSGRLEGIEDRLDAAERALADAGRMTDATFEPWVGRGASLLANVPAAIALDRAYLAELRGETKLAITLASGALGELGQGEWMLAATGRGYLAVAQWLDGQLAEAEHTFLSSLARWREAGEPFVAVRVCELLGQVQRAQGRLDVAVATYEQALEIATPPGHPPPASPTSD
jgi:ATP/maltotriose-dependent transcriptional regulator MalT